MALLGVHTSVAGGLELAFDRGESLGCEAIQIFTRNQLQWHGAEISLAESEGFFRRWRKSSIREVVAHASYLLNLAGARELRAKSVDALVRENRRCDALGINLLVLHPGSPRGEKNEGEGLELLGDALQQVLGATEESRVRLLLETMAGSGNTLGGNLEHFAAVLDLLEDHPRIGVCLDTCHLLAAGYEFRTPATYEHLMRAVGKAVGTDRVGCWHLNDSLTPRGSRRDRHTHVGEGEIGTAPFGFVLQDDRWKDTPCILETPKDGPGDGGNLAVLRKMAGG